MALVAVPNNNAGPVARIQWDNGPLKAVARAGVDAHIDLAADTCAACLAVATAPNNRVAAVVANRAYGQCTHSACDTLKGPAHISSDACVDSTTSLVSRLFAIFSRN